MSTPLPTSTANTTFDVTPRNSIAATLPGWVREPFLHFVLLGGFLFALDYYFLAGADDPRLIVVGADVDSVASETFKASRGRDPNAAELKALRQVWLDNEILYREGLAMEVDRGDDAIRERVIFKALSVVDANIKLPNVDVAELQNWFESNRAKYDEPARFDFEEAILSGDNSEGAVRAFVQRLNSGVPGDVDAGLRVFKGRPQSNLVQSYGAEFAHGLERSPPGEWLALPTRDGWRAVRLDAVTQAKPAVFEAVSGVVLQDWKDAVAAEQRSAAVRELAKKYEIRYGSETP